jgi:mycothiol synthase
MIRYRSFSAGDLESIAKLTETALPRDPLTVERLAETILLEPNFRADGLILAENQEKELVGMIYATVADEGIPHWPESGFITLGAVIPPYRTSNVGQELLDRALAHLHNRGARNVTVAGYPQAYFLPGVDADTYPDQLQLLERNNFTRRSTAAAMHLDLDTFLVPPQVLDIEARRLHEGYQFGTARWDDLPELCDFASEQLAPDWGPVVRAAALRERRGPDRIEIARQPDNRIVGFAMSGAYEDQLERFGPFGVDPRLRRTGLGRILLHRTLRRMRAQGAHGAWFLWTGEHEPAGHLYKDTGFNVVRRFQILKKELAG